jgi:hypothetical protein
VPCGPFPQVEAKLKDFEPQALATTINGLNKLAPRLLKPPFLAHFAQCAAERLHRFNTQVTNRAQDACHYIQSASTVDTSLQPGEILSATGQDLSTPCEIASLTPGWLCVGVAGPREHCERVRAPELRAQPGVLPALPRRRARPPAGVQLAGV